jgi:hypothetical protein
MKQLKSGTYKASNVMFNPSTKIATSYNWWTFVKVINGKLVFNNHAYSTTTQRHQYKVRSVMSRLNMVPDLVIDSRLSLDDGQVFTSAKANLVHKVVALNQAMERKGSRHASNIARQAEIDKIMIELVKLEAMF